MRDNPVRDRLLAGGRAYGVMAFEFFTPGLPFTLAAAGAEFVILDMEHSGVGIETIKGQIASAKGAGIVPMVRVPGLHYHLVAPVLDAGAFGIMVPMMETGAQAELLANWCRYRPEGRRGLGFGLGHDDYASGDPVAKMAAANRRTLTIALVESAAGIANIDAILAVPGIDVAWLGHYDLTDSLGIPAQFGHPDFTAAVARFLEACQRHGKPAGIVAAGLDDARAWTALGFRCLCYGTDVGLLRGALAAGLTGLKQAESKGGNEP